MDDFRGDPGLFPVGRQQEDLRGEEAELLPHQLSAMSVTTGLHLSFAGAAQMFVLIR